MPVQQVSPLLIGLIVGCFTILGVVLKIVYDSLAARRAAQKDRLERFAPERREAYDRFLQLVRDERLYQAALRSLAEEHHNGRTDMSEKDQEAFPASPMPHLVATLDSIRRLARNYAVITTAEAIVRLYGDMAGAQRIALQTPGPNDEITWFLLQRFLDDRIDEFVHAYREDLGLGRPVGGPKKFPVVDRIARYLWSGRSNLYAPPSLRHRKRTRPRHRPDKGQDQARLALDD